MFLVRISIKKTSLSYCPSYIFGIEMWGSPYMGYVGTCRGIGYGL